MIPCIKRSIGASAMVLALLAPAPSWGAIGAASLEVMGASSTPTHWDVPLGVETMAILWGVSVREVGNPLPPTIPVWIKSSDGENTMVVADRIADTNDYRFSYLPPGDACGSTIVAYTTNALSANNDLADDGVRNGSGRSASGIRFVDTQGEPLLCVITARTASSWGRVKSAYR